MADAANLSVVDWHGMALYAAGWGEQYLRSGRLAQCRGDVKGSGGGGSARRRHQITMQKSGFGTLLFLTYANPERCSGSSY